MKRFVEGEDRRQGVLLRSISTIISARTIRFVSGEIGVTGTVGAIANAVWHATGVRVRRYPIRIDDIAIAR